VHVLWISSEKMFTSSAAMPAMQQCRIEIMLEKPVFFTKSFFYIFRFKCTRRL